VFQHNWSTLVPGNRITDKKSLLDEAFKTGIRKKWFPQSKQLEFWEIDIHRSSENAVIGN
jgi:hypothetical protein